MDCSEGKCFAQPASEGLENRRLQTRSRLAYWTIGCESSASAKPVYLSSIAFRRPAHGRGREMHHGLALSGNFGAGLATRVSFAVQGLGDDGRATNVAELQNFDFEVSTFRSDLKHVADMNFTRRFRWLLIGLDSSKFAGPRGHRARLEEARGP